MRNEQRRLAGTSNARAVRGALDKIRKTGRLPSDLVFVPLKTDHTCINTAQGNSVLGQRDAKEAARQIAKDR
jgi:hypothetical protein